MLQGEKIRVEKRKARACKKMQMKHRPLLDYSFKWGNDTIFQRETEGMVRRMWGGRKRK